MNLHYEMVSEDMRITLNQLMSIDELKVFRLVGGTGLALQLGHRSSVDIDLFAGGGAAPPNELVEILRTYFQNNFQINRVQRLGLAAMINNVKVDLYDWKVPFANEPNVVDNIRMATIEDIFAFKCEAVLGRRVEKDFCDLAEIMKHRPLENLLSTFKMRYPYINVSAIFAILLKPDDFERDTSIRYADGKSYDEYRQSLIATITNYENQLLLDKEKKLGDREKRIQALIDQKKSKQKKQP